MRLVKVERQAGRIRVGLQIIGETIINGLETVELMMCEDLSKLHAITKLPRMWLLGIGDLRRVKQNCVSGVWVGEESLPSEVHGLQDMSGFDP